MMDIFRKDRFDLVTVTKANISCAEHIIRVRVLKYLAHMEGMDDNLSVG